jgi:hypothetical protein
MQQRYFTLDEANELVPWLQGVFERASPLASQARQIEGELRELSRKTSSNGGGSVQEQIRQKRQDGEEIGNQIREAVQEILDAGIVVRTLESGLVDFPCWWEGREVYLCWVVGETEIGYWHETDAGFAGRQPL